MTFAPVRSGNSGPARSLGREETAARRECLWRGVLLGRRSGDGHPACVRRVRRFWKAAALWIGKPQLKKEVAACRLGLRKEGKGRGVSGRAHPRGLCRLVHRGRSTRGAFAPARSAKPQPPDGFEWGYGGSGPSQLA